jgi:ABC-type sugar transport system substrate-binding protein
MKTLRIVSILAVIVTVVALAAACAPPAPTPEPAKQEAPTAAPPPTTAPEPTKAPEPAKPTEPPQEAAPTSKLFPNYPTTLPAHCDPAAVKAAMAKAEELWVNPLQDSSGWKPDIRPAQKRYKIGYIQGLGGWPADTRMVNSSKVAADLMCVDLVFCDSKYEAEASINCAQVMKDQKVEGIINSNWFAPSMEGMADILTGIPVVVNEVPMPNSTFFGVDNCKAGTTAGEYLVEWVKKNYTGSIADIWVTSNENPDVGEVPQMRIGCMETAVKAGLPEIPADHYVRIPGGSFTDKSFEAMTTWLTAHPEAKMILTTNINDNGAVGAATACDSAGRTANCAVVGHGGEAQAWNELDKPDNESALKASVDYVQNEYGRYLLPAIVDKIEGKQLPDELHNYIYNLDRSNMEEHKALRPKD